MSGKWSFFCIRTIFFLSVTREIQFNDKTHDIVRLKPYNIAEKPNSSDHVMSHWLHTVRPSRGPDPQVGKPCATQMLKGVKYTSLVCTVSNIDSSQIIIIQLLQVVSSQWPSSLQCMYVCDIWTLSVVCFTVSYLIWITTVFVFLNLPRIF